MEFDKNRVYTAVNADELKVGSKVIVADSLEALKRYVANPSDEDITILKDIKTESYMSRFVVESKFQASEETAFVLAYLVSESEEKKLEWTALKVGDIVRNVHSGREYLVTGLDKQAAGYNISIAGTWVDTDVLEMHFEKVEE